MSRSASRSVLIYDIRISRILFPVPARLTLVRRRLIGVDRHLVLRHLSTYFSSAPQVTVDRRPKRDSGKFFQAIDRASNLYRGRGLDRRRSGPRHSHISPRVIDGCLAQSGVRIWAPILNANTRTPTLRYFLAPSSGATIADIR